jgi:hypothetical protein
MCVTSDVIFMRSQVINFMVHRGQAPSISNPDRQQEMIPFIGGGDMIREVHKDTVTYNDPPMKFEAGTPGIVQTIGLGVALEYMMRSAWTRSPPMKMTARLCNPTTVETELVACSQGLPPTKVRSLALPWTEQGIRMIFPRFWINAA